MEEFDGEVFFGLEVCVPEGLGGLSLSGSFPLPLDIDTATDTATDTVIVSIRMESMRGWDGVNNESSAITRRSKMGSVR